MSLIRYAPFDFETFPAGLRAFQDSVNRLFTEPNAMAHLRSPEGITRPFETVDAAQGFVEEVKQAIAATPAYWQRAEAFPGRE